MHSITARKEVKDSKEMGRTEFNSIDIFKFICAILVISIHVRPLGYPEDDTIRIIDYIIRDCISRIAVPFYFVAAGFFLFRKTTTNFSSAPTKTYVAKLLRLYIIWTLIYLPFRIRMISADTEGIMHGLIMFGRDTVFTGSYRHLWYLPAIMFSVVLVAFLLSKNVKPGRILVIASIFYAIGLLGQSWFGIIRPLREAAPEIWSFLRILRNIIGTTRDGLFDGFLFVSMGAYFAYNGFRIPKRIALIGIVITYILMIIESLCVKRYGLTREQNMYIFLVPLTYFVFGFAIKWQIPNDSSIFKHLRVSSSLMINAHLWIEYILKQLYEMMGIHSEETCLLFLSTVVCSIVFSSAVYTLSKKARFKCLRKLYS